MINTDVCKKCQFKAIYSRSDAVTGDYAANWTCLHGDPRTRLDKMTSPPKECPKILEHAVAEGMKDAE